jgi:hypothetical protein
MKMMALEILRSLLQRRLPQRPLPYRLLLLVTWQQRQPPKLLTTMMTMALATLHLRRQLLLHLHQPLRPLHQHPHPLLWTWQVFPDKR